MSFPNLCIDNFLHDPYKLLDLSKRVPYHSCKEVNENWPGKRSPPLHQLDRDLYYEICKKILCIFYPVDDIDYMRPDIGMHFQIIEPNVYGSVTEGWVHCDQSLASGLIYLSEGMNKECGTSIYAAKEFNVTEKMKKYTDIKTNLYQNFCSSKEEHYKQAIRTHNSMFEETIKFNNVFNRMIMFDGRHYHGVPQLQDQKNSRLTLVFFIYNLNNANLPVNNTKYFSI